MRDGHEEVSVWVSGIRTTTTTTTPYSYIVGDVALVRVSSDLRTVDLGICIVQITGASGTGDGSYPTTDTYCVYPY